MNPPPQEGTLSSLRTIPPLSAQAIAPEFAFPAPPVAPLNAEFLLPLRCFNKSTSAPFGLMPLFSMIAFHSASDLSLPYKLPGTKPVTSSVP